MKQIDQITKIQLDEQMPEIFPEYDGIVSTLHNFENGVL